MTSSVMTGTSDLSSSRLLCHCGAFVHRSGIDTWGGLLLSFGPVFLIFQPCHKSCDIYSQSLYALVDLASVNVQLW